MTPRQSLFLLKTLFLFIISLAPNTTIQAVEDLNVLSQQNTAAKLLMAAYSQRDRCNPYEERVKRKKGEKRMRGGGRE